MSPLIKFAEICQHCNSATSPGLISCHDGVCATSVLLVLLSGKLYLQCSPTSLSFECLILPGICRSRFKSMPIAIQRLDDLSRSLKIFQNHSWIDLWPIAIEGIRDPRTWSSNTNRTKVTFPEEIYVP